MLDADFDRAVKAFIPTRAHPKSAQYLCLAFGVCFRDCWTPACRAQYCVPVVLELCAALELNSAEVFNMGWVFRSWLGDFPGMNVPEAYRPTEPPVMSAAATSSDSDVDKMIDILSRHIDECARCMPHTTGTQSQWIHRTSYSHQFLKRVCSSLLSCRICIRHSSYIHVQGHRCHCASAPQQTHICSCREADEGLKWVRAVVLELEMPKLLLYTPSSALDTVHRMRQDGRTIKGL